MQLPPIIIFDIAIITLAILYIIVDVVSILRQPLIDLDHELLEPSFQFLPPTSSLQHHRKSSSTTMSEPTLSVRSQEDIVTPATASTPEPIVFSRNDGDKSSGTSDSDGSHTQEEYQMGLDYYTQSRHSEDPFPYNPDGTWYLSPAIVDQIALVDKPDLDESEKDDEIELLVYLIDQEFQAGSPRESAVDVAGAIEKGIINPWDNRPLESTSQDRVMLWRAHNPSIYVSYAHDPAPAIGEPEPDWAPCGCDISDPEVLCFGDICAVVKEGSSANQAARAENLFNANVKNDEMGKLVQERDMEAGFVAGRDDGFRLEREEIEELIEEFGAGPAEDGGDV
jgi:hypothetical protein